jgi:mRNA-degrading endonuclease toxin of MazEF toxin-antitoxin module
MKVKRGDVILLDHPFSGGVGSKVRPVLVVQADRDNARLTNTIVAMITRTIHRVGRVETQFLIDIASPEGKAAGLKATSVVNCSNLFTVNEQLLRRKIGEIPPSAMQHIDDCLKAALGIP